MKCIVTGSSGFLGTHLCSYLKLQGHSTYGIDSRHPKYSTSLDSCTHFFKCRLGEETKVEDKNYWALQEYMRGADILYHLAADATEGRSQFTPWNCTFDNMAAAMQIFGLAIEVGVKRIVFTSSMAVYGNQTPPFKEITEPSPVDIYGVNKAATEKCLQILSDVHGVEYCILRPHNCYGPFQNMGDPYRNVVGIFINRIKRGLPIYVYGDGLQKRAFTYVHDIIWKLAETGWADACKNKIFNIGADHPCSVNSLAVLIYELMRGDTKVDIVYVEDRPHEVKNAYCDNSHWNRTTKQVRPDTDLKDGIKKTIEWANGLTPEIPEYVEFEITKGIPITWEKQLI